MANDRIPSRSLRPSQRSQHGDLKVSFAYWSYADRLDRVDVVQALGNGEAWSGGMGRGNFMHSRHVSVCGSASKRVPGALSERSERRGVWAVDSVGPRSCWEQKDHSDNVIWPAEFFR